MDELSRRRPDFDAAYSVELGDGQAWWLPRPALSPSERAGDLEILLDSAGERLQFTVEHVKAMVRLATLLLCRNYDLSDAECGLLLSVDVNDPVSVDRWRKVNRALVGVAPQDDAGATFSRWVKITLLANGVRASDMSVSEAVDVAYYLLALKRAVPPSKYCDASALAAAEAEIGQLV